MMRAALSDFLVEFGSKSPKNLVISGDHGYALFDEFRRVCGPQFINAGVAEQNMIGVAAGLARAGFLPIAYGLSAFVPIRVLEQIKIDVCHDNLPILFLGDGAGLVYSTQSTTHQSGEDIACTRVLPHLTVLSPADRFELTACMQHFEATRVPTYMRIGKSDIGDIHNGPVEIIPGRMIQVTAADTGLTMIATGSMVKLAKTLSETAFPASVWSVPCIKPLDATQVAAIAAKSKIIVTLEEHSIYGGLGSAIAEIASEHAPVRILRVGIEDRFSEFCGTYNYLRHEHRLDQEAVACKIQRYLDRV